LSFPYSSRNFRAREPLYRRNGKIRAREVRVLDENKEQLGVMSLSEALRLAQSKGLDLLETVPNAIPPVCRIVNYGKFQYEEAKKAKESHSHNAASKMKELQLSPVIAAHDFDTKLTHAIGFLSDDMKVCIKLRFRGRQRAHKEFGFEMVNRFVAATAAYGRPDAPPKMLGERDLTVIISPLPREKRGKAVPAAARPASTKAPELSPKAPHGEAGPGNSQQQDPPPPQNPPDGPLEG
jgi:translation initiation factor IF-3